MHGGSSVTKEQIKDFTLRVSQANHSGLVVLLFEIEESYLKDAEAAYNDGDIEQYMKNMELAKKAHNEIMSAVNPGDRSGAKMLSVLRYIYSRLIDSTVKRKPQELDRCMGMMERFKVCFDKLQEIDDPEPVMKNTHQVYAGLTYGKGTLNESVDMSGYSSRGFKV